MVRSIFVIINKFILTLSFPFASLTNSCIKRNWLVSLSDLPAEDTGILRDKTMGEENCCTHPMIVIKINTFVDKKYRLKILDILKNAINQDSIVPNVLTWTRLLR